MMATIKNQIQSMRVNMNCDALKWFRRSNKKLLSAPAHFNQVYNEALHVTSLRYNMGTEIFTAWAHK